MRGVAPLAAATMACLSVTQPAVTFDSARAFEDLKKIVAIGPRPAGSPGARQARDYIARELQAIGLAAVEQPFETQTPAGVTRMVNLRVALPGAAAGGRFVIGGHYDTKRFSDITFVGANDGGSSTAFLVELARTLKRRQNALPIEIVFFDGEEAVVEWTGTDHTYGSRHYVQAARADGSLRQIRAMILVDMIGDRDLRVLRDTNSTRWLVDAVWTAAQRLKRREFVEEQLAVEDDHIEFLRAGVPAVDLIDLDYPAWHTAADTVDKVSAKSLQAVADVLMAALPDIERRLVVEK